MRARNIARSDGCTEHRRLGSVGNGKDSLEASNRFDEGNDDHHKRKGQNGEGTVVFTRGFHGVLGWEIKRWRIRQDREPNFPARRTSKADRRK